VKSEAPVRVLSPQIWQSKKELKTGEKGGALFEAGKIYVKGEKTQARSSFDEDVNRWRGKDISQQPKTSALEGRGKDGTLLQNRRKLRILKGRSPT